MPNAWAFSSAFLIPPEQWPPRSTGATLPEPRMQARGLVLELTARRAWERGERLEPDPVAFFRPQAGDQAVHQERLLDVPIALDRGLAVLVGEDARAVLVREQQLVPARQQARRRRRVRGHERCPWEVEDLAPPFVAEAPEAQCLEAGLEVPNRHTAPLGHVGAGGRSEGTEVAADGERRRLGARRLLVVPDLVGRRAAEGVEGRLRRLLEPAQRHHPEQHPDLGGGLRARVGGGRPPHLP